MIPALRPCLPTADAILPYLREIDRERRYTNFGPLQTRLRNRLAEWFGFDADRVVLLSNATAALTAALKSLDRRGGVCAVPAWTFSASCAAIVDAGMTPYFIDITPASWSPKPDHALADRLRGCVDAVMPVMPFGAPIDLAAWRDFATATDIAVVVDGAAGFDSLLLQASLAMTMPGHVIISLHATKVFPVGEGAMVLCRNAQEARDIVRYANFGRYEESESVVAGSNAKLSEYHAAVGLAMYDLWPERRRALAAITQHYRDGLAGSADIEFTPGFGDGWVGSMLNVTMPCADAVSQVRSALAKAGIETRNWWRGGCHRLAAYRDFATEEMPMTDQLAARAVGLPFSPDLTLADIDRVVAALKLALGC